MKKTISTVVVVIAAVCLWLFVPRKHEPSQVQSADAFFQSWTLRHAKDLEDVPAEFEMHRDHREFVLLSFVPQKPLPETLDNRSVILPEEWPIAIVLYPEGENPADIEQSVHRDFLEFNNSRRIAKYSTNEEKHKHSRVIVGNATPLIGGVDQPALPEATSDGEITFFAMLALSTRRERKPGRYYLELWLYPTSSWESRFRSTIGPAIVFYRGTVNVT